MHSWPQDILRYMFLVAPTPYTIIELAAFFFGNGIPLTQAIDFVRECFSPSHDDLEDFFRSKYNFWERLRDISHLYEYYDMSWGQIVLLRGANCRDQVVVVEESFIPIKVGFGVDIFPPSVMQKIEGMRADTY